MWPPLERLRRLEPRAAPALHTLCTLRSKAEAAAEREAHSYEKIDFDGCARADVGCGGRLGACEAPSRPTLSPRPPASQVCHRVG